MADCCFCCGKRNPSTDGILCRSCWSAFQADKSNYGITEGEITSITWARIQKTMLEMERAGKTQAEIDEKIAEIAAETNQWLIERRKKLEEQGKEVTMDKWLASKHDVGQPKRSDYRIHRSLLGKILDFFDRF